METKDILDTDEGPLEEKKEDGNKVEKAFNSNLDKFEALLNRRPDKKRRKVGDKRLDNIVEDLWKEDDAKLEAELRTELRTALDGYITLNEEIQKKEEELKNLRTQKMKEFNEKCRKVWSKIEGGEGTMMKRISALKASAGVDSTKTD